MVYGCIGMVSQPGLARDGTQLRIITCKRADLRRGCWEVRSQGRDRAAGTVRTDRFVPARASRGPVAQDEVGRDAREGDRGTRAFAGLHGATKVGGAGRDGSDVGNVLFACHAQKVAAWLQKACRHACGRQDSRVHRHGRERSWRRYTANTGELVFLTGSLSATRHPDRCIRTDYAQNRVQRAGTQQPLLALSGMKLSWTAKRCGLY